MLKQQEMDRSRTEQGFMVPLADIVSNDYYLSINKYKEIVYEKVEYESIETIAGRIEEIEKDIQQSKIEWSFVLDSDIIQAEALGLKIHK